MRRRRVCPGPARCVWKVQAAPLVRGFAEGLDGAFVQALAWPIKRIFTAQRLFFRTGLRRRYGIDLSAHPAPTEEAGKEEVEEDPWNESVADPLVVGA